MKEFSYHSYWPGGSWSFPVLMMWPYSRRMSSCVVYVRNHPAEDFRILATVIKWLRCPGADAGILKLPNRRRRHDHWKQPSGKKMGTVCTGGHATGFSSKNTHWLFLRCFLDYHWVIRKGEIKQIKCKDAAMGRLSILKYSYQTYTRSFFPWHPFRTRERKAAYGCFTDILSQSATYMPNAG